MSPPHAKANIAPTSPHAVASSAPTSASPPRIAPFALLPLVPLVPALFEPVVVPLEPLPVPLPVPLVTVGAVGMNVAEGLERQDDAAADAAVPVGLLTLIVAFPPKSHEVATRFVSS